MKKQASQSTSRPKYNWFQIFAAEYVMYLLGLLIIDSNSKLPFHQIMISALTLQVIVRGFLLVKDAAKSSGK